MLMNVLAVGYVSIIVQITSVIICVLVIMVSTWILMGQDVMVSYKLFLALSVLQAVVFLEYSLQINSFQATLKSADSVSLDWQLDSDPYIQDILGLIESISINQISDTSSLLHLPLDRRSALLFNLLPNVLYTYELFILTIHGDLITSRISVATPPDG